MDLHAQRRSLSGFLRDASQGKSTPPPSEVGEIRRKYGFTGQLSRAVAISLLSVFALGLGTPEVRAAELASSGQVVAPVAKPARPFDSGKLLAPDTDLVVIGNNHTAMRQADYLISQLPAWKARGMGTLYLELPRKDTRNTKRLQADYEAAIENLSRSNNPSAKSELARMRCMLKVLVAAKEAKMEIVGVDREMKEVTAKNGSLVVPADSRLEFYRKYVIGRNQDFADNIKAHGKPGVFYVGRAHIGIKNDPFMKSIETELGAEGGFALKDNLTKAGLRARVVVLSSQDEVAGLPHPFAKLMEQRGATDKFRIAEGGDLSGDYLMFVPEMDLSKDVSEEMTMHRLPEPKAPNIPAKLPVVTALTVDRG